MRRFQFSDDEYRKLAEVTGFSVMDLQKLDAMGLLQNSTAVRMVFKYEYEKCKKLKLGTRDVIVTAIVHKYDVSPRIVREVLFSREAPVYYCKQCRKEMTQAEYRKRHGVCFDCAVKNVQL